jgi:DNA-binding transcriptional regulator GbsR (MarR family)
VSIDTSIDTNENADVSTEDPKTAKAIAEFIEEMGITYEAFGLTRMEGRLLGALLVAIPAEQSAEDLAETLQASRGSISSAVRRLEVVGLSLRLSKPGERKDYFRMVPNAWNQMMHRRVKAMTALRQLMERGLASVQDRPAEDKRNLQEAVAFYRFWEESLDLLISHWHAGNTNPNNVFAPLPSEKND